MRRRGDLGKRAFAAILCAAMLVTSTPVQTMAVEVESQTENVEVTPAVSETPAVTESDWTVPVETEIPETDGTSDITATEEEKTASTNWTDKKEELSVIVEKVSCKDANNSEQEIKGEKYKLDLSALDPGQITEFSFYINVKGLKSAADRQVRGGDVLNLTFPATYLTVKDTDNDVTICNRDTKDVVASYVIKDNVLTVTFDDALEARSVLDGVIELPVQMNTEALSESTVAEALITGVENKVLLPVKTAETTEIPKVTATPEATETPEMTGIPEVTEVPEITETPEVTATPETTETPEVTATPETTEIPELTELPENEEMEEPTEVSDSFTAWASRSAMTPRSILADLNRSAGITKAANSNTSVYVVNPAPEGFDRIIAQMTTTNDGYSTTSNSRQVDFGFVYNLNNDYLDKVLQEETDKDGFPDADSFGEDQLLDYDQAVYDYFMNQYNGDTKAPSYSFDLGSIFAGTTSDQELKLTITLQDDAGNSREYEIGTAEVVIGEGETDSSLKIQFHNGVFAFLDVAGNFKLSMLLDTTRFEENKKYDVVWQDGKPVTVEEKKQDSQEPDTGADDQIHISKSAIDETDTREFVYTISLEGDENYVNSILNGWILEDPIDKDLEITEIMLAKNGTLPVTVYNSSNSYTPDPALAIDKNANTISYAFPSKTDAASEIKSAVFEITVRMTDEAYYAAVNDSGNVNKTYLNQATLKKGSGDEEKDIVSDQVFTTVKMTSLEKVGQQQTETLTGDEYKWTLNTNIYLPAGSKSYLIDTFDNDIHTIDAGNTIMVTKGETATSYKVVELSDAEEPDGYLDGDANQSLRFDDGLQTRGMVDTVLSQLGVISPEEQTVYKYVYRYTDGDVVRHQAVMLIPYDNHTDGKATVTYTTHLREDLALESGETLSQWMEGKKVSNEIRFVWDYDGTGPGPNDWYVDIDKTGTGNYKHFSKKGVEYDADTQKVTWQFEVNKQFHNSLTEVLIKDALGTTAEFDSLKYTLYQRESSEDDFEIAGKGSVPAGSTGSEAPCYTLDEDNTLQIHLGTVTSDQYYELTLVTKCKDGSLLNTQNVVQYADNNATMTGLSDGILFSDEVKAVRPIQNTLIQKAVLPQSTADDGTKVYFDSSTNLIRWKVTVNQNHTPVTRMTMTDVLPEGTQLWEIESIIEKSQDGTSVELAGDKIAFYDGDAPKNTANGTFGTGYTYSLTSETDTGMNANYANQTLTMGFGAAENTNSYVITFTTKVQKVYLDNELIYGVTNGETKQVTFHNEASLTGKVYDQEIDSRAKAEASTTVSNTTATKSGKVTSKDGDLEKITWTLDINSGKLDLGTGASIYEAYSTLMEYAPDSIRIYQDSISSENLLAGTDASAAEDWKFKESYPTPTTPTTSGKNEFTMTIPDAYKNSHLIITFDTYIVEDILPEDVNNLTNNLTVESEGGSSSYSTGDVRSDYNGTFDIYHDVTATTRPLISIRKSSSNDKAGETLNLPGAVFTSTRYGKSNNTMYTASVVKSKTTNSNGNANFANLTPGNSNGSYIYRIEETAAPRGYEKTEKQYFVVFYTDESEKLDAGIYTLGNDGTLTVNADGSVTYAATTGQTLSGDDVVLQQISRNDEGRYNAELLNVKDNPIDHDFVITKTGQNYYDSESSTPITGVLPYAKFTVSVKDAPLSARTVYADENGKIVLENLDAGVDGVTYTLQEQQFTGEDDIAEVNGIYNKGFTSTSPEIKRLKVHNYEQGTVSIKVTHDGVDYKYEVSGDDVTQDSTTEAYTLSNDYITGSLKVKKTETYTGSAQSDIRFAIFGRDSLNADYSIPLDINKRNGNCFTCGSDGVATLVNIPYSPYGYAVVEVGAQNNGQYYILNGPEVTLVNGNQYQLKDGTGIPQSSADYHVVYFTAADMEEGISGNSFTVTKITGNDIFVNERILGKLNIIKTFDAVTGTPKPGDTFTFRLEYISKNSDTEKDKYLENSDGKATTDWGFTEGTDSSNNKIYYKEATITVPVDTTTTDWNRVRFDKLPYGRYKITESVNGVPYQSVFSVVNKNNATVSETGVYHPTSVTANTSFESTVTVQNKIRTAELAFIKTNKTTGETFTTGEATFRLTGTNYYEETVGDKTDAVTGEKYYEAATGANGTVDLSYIPYGQLNAAYNEDTQSSTPWLQVLPYTLTETQADGYVKEMYHVYVYGAKTDSNTDANIAMYLVNSEGKDMGKNLLGSTVPNQPITGEINLTKRILADTSLGLNDVNTKPLAGAKFTLTRVKDDGVTVVTSYGNDGKVTSDDSGNVTFSGMEYGTYILTETNAPEGYKPMASPVTITKAMLKNGLSADKTTFTYTVTGSENGDSITNELIYNSASFKKTDQDGNVLGGVKFNVYRRGDNVEVGGSGYVAGVASAVRSFGMYGPVSEVTTAADGTFSITLPYGDYLLTEQPGLNLQADKDGYALYLEVREEGVTVYRRYNFEGELTSVTLPEDEATAQTKVWSQLTADSSNVYELVNDLKYGYVDLCKVAGDLDGEKVVYGDKKLAGAKFTIYKEGETTPYLVLTTTNEGRLPAPDDGFYTYGDKKVHLFYGNYEIAETAAPKGYTGISGKTAFTISDDTTGMAGTAWLYTGADKNTAVKYLLAGKQAEDTNDNKLVNEINRGAFTIQKVSSTDENKALTGAQFTVYVDSTPVASLQDTGNNGTYTLSNVNGSPTYDVTDTTTGYLYHDGTQWKLLPGTYTVRETTAPAGYELARDLTVTIEADGSVSMTGVNYATMYAAGRITLKDTPIIITLKKVDSETGEGLSGAQFVITPVNGSSFATTQTGDRYTFDVDSSGSATIGEGILAAGNSYEFTESVTPDGYKTAASFVITIEPHGTMATTSEGISFEDDRVTVKVPNTKNDVTIAKKDFKNNILSGYSFKVTGSFVDGTTEKIVDDGSNKDALKGQLFASREDNNYVYTVTETKAPDGYELAAPVKFTVNTNGKIQLVGTSTNAEGEDTEQLVVKDQEIEAVLTKYDGGYDGTGVAGADPAPMAGVSFTLTNSVDPSDTQTKVTDQYGQIYFKSAAGDSTFKVVGGTAYQLTEDTPTGYVGIPETQVIVGTDGKITFTPTEASSTTAGITGTGTESVTVTNIRRTGTLTIRKIDLGESDAEKNQLAGATFQLKYKDVPGETEGGVAATLTTNADGTASVSKLQWGTYTLVETQAPTGYILDPTPREVTITKEALTVDWTSAVSQIGNRKNSLTIYKTDEEGEQKLSATFKLERRTCTDPDVYEEIRLTGDSSQGIALVGLAAGTYRLTEVTAPTGYALPVAETDRSFVFTMGEDGKVTSTESGKPFTIFNGTAVEKVYPNTITMTDKRITAVLVKNGDTLGEAQFEITGRFADTPVGVTETTKTITNSNRDMVLSGQLIGGQQYSIRETVAPAGYKKPEGQKQFILKVAVDGSLMVEAGTDSDILLHGTTMEIVGETTVRVTDEPLDITLKKVEEGEAVTPLEGISFTLTGKFSDQTASKVLTSGSDGALRCRKTDDTFMTAEEFVRLLYVGETYTITETSNYDDYFVSGTSLTFTVQEDGTLKFADGYDDTSFSGDKTDAITVTNRRMSAALELTKQDADTHEAMAGVEFSLTYEATDNGALKAENVPDYAAQTCTTDASGVLHIDGLVKGNYTLTEKKTLDGYAIGSVPFCATFTVENDWYGQTRGMESLTPANEASEALMVDGVLVNHKTGISILKVDENHQPLAGAQIVIKDAQGNRVTGWTSETVSHDVTGILNVGEEYVLSEVTAPEGYHIAADQKFTLDADSMVNGTKTLTMVDMREDATTEVGSIRVTKYVTFNNRPMATSVTYHAALFSDSACTSRVSDVKELVLNGQYSTTADFASLALGTYYVAETDEYGNVFAGSSAVTVTITGAECTLTANAPHGTAVIDNDVTTRDHNYDDKTGSITVTKKVQKGGKNVLLKNENFYVALFVDEEHTALAGEVKTLAIAGKASASVTFSDLQPGIYYIAETDEEGVPVDDTSDDFYFEVSLSDGGVTIEGTGDSHDVTLTNSLKDSYPGEYNYEGAQTPTPTPTATPATSARRTTTGTSATAKTATTTKTGDETSVELWLLILFGAAIAAGGLYAGHRRKKN